MTKAIKKNRSVKLAGITSTTPATDATVEGVPALSTIRIRPTAAGSAQLQTTVSPYDEIEAGTAVWDNSGSAAVAITSTVANSAFTGVRVVPTTGTWVLEIAGHGVL